MNRTAWMAATERGSILGIRVMVGISRCFGYRAARVFLFPVVLYFYFTGTAARRASRDYLFRLHRFSPESFSRPPGARAGFGHFAAFAESALDRFWLWSARDRGAFQIQTEGADEVDACQATGRGALFIGAHVGTFDVLRSLSVESNIRVNAVMYLENAQKFNSVMAALHPDAGLRIINLMDRNLDAILEMKSCVERGEIVAILGDRFYRSARSRGVRCSFLGEETLFPSNPWIVAHLLECPVFLVAGVKSGSRRFHCVARRVADRIELKRRSRETELQHYVEIYVRFLESLCCRFPLQWFNFFPFWSVNPDD